MLTAIITDCFDEKPESFRKHIRRIISVMKNFQPYVILVPSHQTLDLEGTVTGKLIEQEFEEVTLVLSASGTFGMPYLEAIEKALSLNADKIVEIDSSGGHLPEEIPRFLEALETHDAALSTRFAYGGSNSYPQQRVLISKLGTKVSNFLLGIHLTDGTSGFEGYTGELATRLFKAYSKDMWLSANRGPFHFYQTEMRALLCTICKMDNKYTYTEVPITYGKEKHGKNLKLRYVVNAFLTFVIFCLRFTSVKRNITNTADNK